MLALPSQKGVSTVEACLELCTGAADCVAFTLYGDSSLCVLKSSDKGDHVPANPTTVSGCEACGGTTAGDASVFVLIRGVYGPLPITVAGVPIPPTARLISQFRYAILQPLDYYNLVDVPVQNGLVVMTTLAVTSGTANFMEGCFHFSSPYNASFPGEILSTGTEDYYDSGSVWLIRWRRDMYLPWIAGDGREGERLHRLRSEDQRSNLSKARLGR